MDDDKPTARNFWILASKTVSSEGGSASCTGPCSVSEPKVDQQPTVTHPSYGIIHTCTVACCVC